MSLDKRIASVARTLFLPEFSFAANKFQVERGEYELADHVVWVDDLLVAIQMKERQRNLPEENWFEKKVLKVATHFSLIVGRLSVNAQSKEQVHFRLSSRGRTFHEIPGTTNGIRQTNHIFPGGTTI